MDDGSQIVVLVIAVVIGIILICYGISRLISAPERRAIELKRQRRSIAATGEQIRSSTATRFDAIEETQQKLAVSLCAHCGAARPSHTQTCPRCHRQA